MTQYGLIQELEMVLQDRISDAQGSPFISHYDVSSVSPGLEEAAIEELVSRVGGCFNNFLRLMSIYPCVCTRVVATALAKFYGQDGDVSVYKLISGRLGLGEDVPVSQRHSLHDKFKRCCESIGLTLPASADGHKMVSTYLFQAGVSHSQLLKLAPAFLKAERLLGLPRSDDDTREVDDWENRAVELTPPGNKVLRRIVQEDSTGYHGATFIRLRRFASSPSPGFETEFKNAIQRAETDELAKGVRRGHDLNPLMEFAQGDLWVAIPRGANRLEICIHGRIHPLSRGQRLALSLPWPASIKWRKYNNSNGVDAQDWQEFQLFGDCQEILVFDGDTGSYMKTLSLVSQGKERVRAGQLCFLSQTAFRVNEESCHRLGVKAFVLFCDISTQIIICQDGLQCTVGVEARLRLDVLGKKIVRNQDGWLLAGPISIRIHSGRRTSTEYEVRVRHPAMDHELQYPVPNIHDDQLTAGLSINMPTVGSFGLARVSLHIPGQSRALYRAKFWYWPSLEQLFDERIFIATSVPDNWAPKHTNHIGQDHHGRLVVLEGENYLRARLCFRVDQKLVSFNLPPPGVSVSVRKADGTERPIKVGASVVVRDDYASNLIVRYSDPTAAIDVKGDVVEAAFGKTKSWRASFAALNQEGVHNKIRLLFGEKLISERDLVRIVPEAEPNFFEAKRLDTHWFCNVEFEDSFIDAVQIHRKNLIDGKILKTDLTVAATPDHDFTFATAYQKITSNSLQIVIDSNCFEDGIWFITFRIRKKDCDDWFPLVNSSGESYAIFGASKVYTHKLVFEDVSRWCLEANQTRIFLRLSKAVETPLAEPCRWMSRLILDAWKRLGKSLNVCESLAYNSLLKACVLTPSPHAHESWIPVHHPVEINSDLFSVSAEDIGEVLGSSGIPGYEEFELVGLAGLTESLQDAVDLLDISPAFLIAFENASVMQKDPTAFPGTFDFLKYCKLAPMMKDIDDRPLSLWHHDRACERMADRVAITSQNTSQILRLPKVMTLVHRFTVHGESNSLDLPHDLAAEKYALVEKAPRIIAALTKAWRFGNAEAFWHDLSSYTAWPKEKTQKHIGTLFRLAPELFAFYLLLWVLVEKHERV